MPAVLRFDIGRLDRAKRTGAGGLRISATIARTGVQVYTDQDGRRIREYRPPETVFDPQSLATIGSIPVTVGHPPSGVTPLNHRELSVGHVSDAPPRRRSDGPVEWIDADLVVSDAGTLRQIDSGELTEISMGYLAEVTARPGVSPAGEQYDAVVEKITEYNHLALLKGGHARAGKGARLRLDGNQEPLDMFVRSDDNTSPASAPKQLVKVDGIECEKGSDTHISLLERSITAQTARADEAATALTAALTELGTAKATIAAHKPVDVSALVQDELAFRSQILPALPKGYVFAGKTRDQVRADAVGPEVMTGAAKLDSDAERVGYIRRALEIKLDSVGKAPPTLHVPSPITDSTDPNQPKIGADRRADAFTASWRAK